MRTGSKWAAVVATVTAVVIGLGSHPGAVRAATNEDQVQDVVDESFCVQPNEASACYNGAAQTVTAGTTGELVGVALVLDRQAFTTHELAVQIRAGGPTGGLLTTSDPVAAADIPIDPESDWVLFTFPAPATLSAGDVFAIVLPDMDMSPTSDPRWGVGKADADVYAGGVAFGGVMGTSWQQYENGSDFAFVTYMASGEPTCDLRLALTDGDPVDDQLTATVGDEVEVLGFDFEPLGPVTIELTPPEGDPFADGTTADLFGDFAATLELEVTDVGTWQITAWSDDLPECANTVDLIVEAAAAPTASPVPTATPATTPAGTAAATRGPTLPATSTMPGDDRGDLQHGIWPLLVLIGAVAVGGLFITRRTVRRD